MIPKPSNPPSAAKEDISVGYITQLTADSGATFQEHRKDFIGVDGQVDFPETTLRVQLKSTTQKKYWKSSFSYYLEEDWLKKWCGSLSPVVLMLLVINENYDAYGERLPWLNHNSGDYQIYARGYWKRVDQIAKSHDFEKSKGLSVSFDSTSRVSSQTVLEWYSLAMSMYGKGSAG